jgi:hypothetical protein
MAVGIRGGRGRQELELVVAEAAGLAQMTLDRVSKAGQRPRSGRRKRQRGSKTKAVRFHEFGDPDVLRYEDVEEPVPGAGEVRLRVAGSAFNPVDDGIRGGYL